MRASWVGNACSDAVPRSAGDELLVLAEDDDTYSPLPAPVDAQVGPCPVYRHTATKERILFVGWR